MDRRNNGMIMVHEFESALKGDKSYSAIAIDEINKGAIK